VSPWYFGGGAALYCGGQGASCGLSANGLFVSMGPYCGGGYRLISWIGGGGCGMGICGIGGGGCGWGLGCMYA
jgi:hypothetical protein